jgi:hypothetical protein
MQSKIFTFKRTLWVVISVAVFQATSIMANTIPFSTNQSHLTIWNGRNYEPFFIKGMNMGVAVPGKFPGEMHVSRAQYSNWFQMIKDAGFNTLRLYTLHFPQFYEVLDSFNLANPHNPLFFFQGVWLEEEFEGYSGDLLFLSETFKKEIEENVDCVHGKRIISARLGKAWGTYTVDVSRWNVGYIIGREVHPGEVLTTNKLNPGSTSFSGVHFAIDNVDATEAWITSKLDHLVDYELTHHATQRPVSFSSWPTQDPLSHPEEWNLWEDTTSIDLSKIELLNAPAGFFISYHAYPYYPDFVNYGPEYQNFSDDFGPNSYLGYLTHLKAHYPNFPLIVAEYGVPSSWGVAHYSTSGMHHGGFDEYEQGENNIRLLKTIESANCGGGMQFAWIDEWFKRTWVTDHIDYLMDRRILWHNVTAAEQNFGLIAFQRPLQMKKWEEFCPDCHVKGIDAAADYDYLHFKIHLTELPGHLDEMWIALDTYDANLGESILPTGDTLDHGAEFALHITNYSAKLHVTQAYDLYGLFHGISEPEQQYRSVATTGNPWNIVRWKVNEFDQDIQYIGNLKVNYGFLPSSSRDAVTIHSDHIDIRIPWSLLHFVDPSEYVVFHDDRNTYIPEDTISDGIAMSVFYKGEAYKTSERFLWEKWNTALDVEEVIKGSYWVMKDRLSEFNNRAIAINDTVYININGEPAKSGLAESVLNNDFDLDGNLMQALLLSPPTQGRLELNLDGSFAYEPINSNLGIYEDSFTYTVFDGLSLSEPAQVKLYVDVNTVTAENQFLIAGQPEFIVFPNPASNEAILRLPTKINHVYLFDIQGRMIMFDKVDNVEFRLDVSHLKHGTYIVKVETVSHKYVKTLLIN